MSTWLPLGSSNVPKPERRRLVLQVRLQLTQTTSYAERKSSSPLNISSYSTSESSNSSTRRRTFSLVLLFVFSLETWNVTAWDGLVQPTGKYRSIRHMEYPKFQTGIFGRMESALYFFFCFECFASPVSVRLIARQII